MIEESLSVCVIIQRSSGCLLHVVVTCRLWWHKLLHLAALGLDKSFIVFHSDKRRGYLLLLAWQLLVYEEWVCVSREHVAVWTWLRYLFGVPMNERSTHLPSYRLVLDSSHEWLSCGLWHLLHLLLLMLMLRVTINYQATFWTGKVLKRLVLMNTIAKNLWVLNMMSICTEAVSRFSVLSRSLLIQIMIIRYCLRLFLLLSAMHGLKRICRSWHKTMLTQLNIWTNTMDILHTFMAYMSHIVFLLIALDVLAWCYKVTVLRLRRGGLEEEHVVAHDVCAHYLRSWG